MSRAIEDIGMSGWHWCGLDMAWREPDEFYRNRRRVELKMAKKKDRRERRKAKRG